MTATKRPKRGEPNERMDGKAGYHRFVSEAGEYGSFEVFWYAGEEDGPGYEGTKPGWFWWACQPGYIPDGEPIGPFETSGAAYANAREG